MRGPIGEGEGSEFKGEEVAHMQESKLGLQGRTSGFDIHHAGGYMGAPEPASTCVPDTERGRRGCWRGM